MGLNNRVCFFFPEVISRRLMGEKVLKGLYIYAVRSFM